MPNRYSRFALPLFALVLAGAGCMPPFVVSPQPSASQPAPGAHAFGSVVTLRVGDTERYEDGLTVRLAAIDDSRCKPDVQCIWEGELSPLLMVSGGSFGAEREVRLGTSRTPQITVSGYAFLLRNATETAANVVVTRESAKVPATGDQPVRSVNVAPNQVVKSPLVVTGEARGTWYFEASFPVRLLDANGKVLAAEPAQAGSDWMTENFVPFSVTLKFDKPTTATGTLVLQKDNPSGLPEHEDSRSIPVRF